jgi:hypothetical protein
MSQLRAFLDRNKPESVRLVKATAKSGLHLHPDGYFTYADHLLNVLGFQGRRHRYEQLLDGLFSLYSSYEADIAGYLTQERIEEIRRGIERGPARWERHIYESRGWSNETRLKIEMARVVVEDWSRGVDISATSALCGLRDWGIESVLAYVRNADDNYTPAKDIVERFLRDNKNRILEYAISLSDNDISMLRKEVENLRLQLRKEIRNAELCSGGVLSLLEAVAEYRDQLSGS